MLKSCFLSAACVVFAGAAFAQTAAPRLEFEVASVKVGQIPTAAAIASGKIHAGMKIDNARVDIGLMSMMALITKAYDVKQYQVKGPDWILTAVYDIIAKMPEGSTKEQVPQMLQSLLEDRFKLALHRDKKDTAVYALVVGKGGAKLEPYKTDPAAAGDGAVTGSNEVTISGGPGSKSQVVSDGTGTQQKVTPSPDGKSIHVEFTKVPISVLCQGLFRFVGKPIVDMTDLKGDYNASLDITMADIIALQKSLGVGGSVPAASGEGGRPADEASDNFGSSVVQSLQALGLKLEPRKIPLEILTIDHLEKTPTDN